MTPLQYSETATKFEEIFLLFLTLLRNAFSDNFNFNI